MPQSPPIPHWSRKSGVTSLSQNSPKLTSPNPPGGGLEVSEGASAGLHVVRPTLPGAQLPQNHLNQQIGQGIVPPTAQPRIVSPNNADQAEEISTFFKHRQSVAQGSFGLNPLLKFFIFFCVLGGSFIVSWNYIGQFRKRTQKFADEKLGINLAEYVPAWTKRARKFERSVDQEVASRPVAANSSATTNVTPIDPLYMSVVTGQWPLVESHLQGKCDTWEPKSACSLKAWYLTYKGLRSSLRPILKFNSDDLKKLSLREQATFRFALTMVGEPAKSQNYFQDVMTMLNHDIQFKRMLFDARFKQLLRDGHYAELGSLIKMAKDVSTESSEISRWRSLDISMRWSSALDQATAEQRRNFTKQIQDTIQKHGGSFKSDPLAFIPIANMGLFLGLARQVGEVAVPLADEALKAAVDPTIRRDMYVVATRALMLTGEAAQALQKLEISKAKDGVDGISSHLLGSILLEMRSSARIQESIAAFRAAGKMRNSWQSGVGLFLAMVRAGNLREAARFANNLSTFRNKENSPWIDMAMAEYKLSSAKTLNGDAKDRYAEVAALVAGSYQKHPNWTGLAKLYAEALAGSGRLDESQKIRMTMDDLSSKTSYLSSPEFLTSPVGPFGLMR